MGSRSSTQTRWTRRACSTPAMTHSTSYGGEATTRGRSLWRSTVLRTSFYCATMVCLCAPGSKGHRRTELTWGGSTEFAFYINRGGRRSRKNFLVHWEGAPTSFGELTHAFLLDQVGSCAAKQHFNILTYSLSNRHSSKSATSRRARCRR